MRGKIAKALRKQVYNAPNAKFYTPEQLKMQYKLMKAMWKRRER